MKKLDNLYYASVFMPYIKNPNERIKKTIVKIIKGGNNIIFVDLETHQLYCKEYGRGDRIDIISPISVYYNPFGILKLSKRNDENALHAHDIYRRYKNKIKVYKKNRVTV